MPGLWNLADRGTLLAWHVAFLMLPGCGGNEFQAATNQGGMGGDSGAAGAGDGGALAGTAGSGEAGTASGGGGTGSTECKCPSGSYCLDASTDCKACSALNRLRFGPPERLTTISNLPRYPRAGGTGTDLLYQATGMGLRYTTDASTSAGSAVAHTTARDAAPLLLAKEVTSLGDEGAAFNFAFDREELERRELILGKWSSGALQSVTPAPAPFNDGASSNYQLAVAQAQEPGATPRAYWLSDRSLLRRAAAPAAPSPQLLTALLADGSEPEQVGLSVAGCEAPVTPTEALAPWVTPDGGALFFSHDGTCPPAEPDAAADLDLYAAMLVTATGQLAASATRLQDVNSPANERDPSFSADMCQLYFASDRDGELALYRAERR